MSYFIGGVGILYAMGNNGIPSPLLGFDCVYSINKGTSIPFVINDIEQSLTTKGEAERLFYTNEINTSLKIFDCLEYFKITLLNKYDYKQLINHFENKGFKVLVNIVTIYNSKLYRVTVKARTSSIQSVVERSV